MLGMNRKKPPTKNRIPERSRDLLVTQGMLYAVRDELRSEIKSSTLSLKSEFTGLKSEFTGLKSDFMGLKSEFTGLKAEFGDLKSTVEKMAATVAQMDVKFYQMRALMEEQRAENMAVMDGFRVLFVRQDRVEKRVDEVEKTLGDFKK